VNPIDESDHLRFYFLQGKNFQEGMRHGNRLYGLVQSFEVTHHFQAYQLAWALSAQKIPLSLTVSKERYAVWVCLRSPTYALLFHQGRDVLMPALLIDAILCRSKAAILNQSQARSAA
jgi:hypothetical protein